MDEYVSREELIEEIEEEIEVENSFKDGEKLITKGLKIALKDIKKLKTADVQPVKWISVKDRLPETNAIGVAHILAYDRYEGVVKADFLDESANYVNGSNIFEISNTTTQLYKVTHWMPLPDSPKDGDAE